MKILAFCCLNAVLPNPSIKLIVDRLLSVTLYTLGPTAVSEVVRQAKLSATCHECEQPVSIAILSLCPFNVTRVCCIIAPSTCEDALQRETPTDHMVHATCASNLAKKINVPDATTWLKIA